MKKQIRIVLLCILALIIVQVGILPCFEGTTNANKGNEEWMKALDDSFSLDAIYLPGTHDSCAYASDFAFASRCQSLTIEQQLNAGIRYLDLRVGIKNDELIMIHGPLTCRKGFFKKPLTLHETLTTIETFLTQHPSEMVLVNIKASEQAQDTYNTYMESHINAMYRVDNTLPTIQEGRGKIVLANRYLSETNATYPLVMMWYDQRNTTFEEPVFEEGLIANQHLFVQDHFCLNTNEKWQSFIYPHVHTGVYLNFLSTKGPSKVGHPYKYAKALNKQLATFDLTSSGPQIVVLDFADANLASHILQANFE